ncbi:transcriptional repressor LexA [Patescibacteria group bacterium]
MAPILPKKKKELLAFLKDYINNNGYAPTLTEIAKHYGLSSLATVHEHLSFLEQRGFIKRDKSQARGISVKENLVEKKNIGGVPLPLLGTITAGAPIEAIEDRQDNITVPQEVLGNKESYLLKVKGDSMIESNISDGDYVIVEKTSTAKNGEMIVALLDDGSATLKKFYKQKSNIKLQPANKNYNPLIVPNVAIQGRVLGIIRKY